jgi:thymidylate kinase
MHLEFCGVPGSGKSTLSSAVLSLLKKNEISVLDRKSLVDTALARRNFGILANTLSKIIPEWRRDFLGLPHSLSDWHQFVADHPEFTSYVHSWLATEKTLSKDWRLCVYYAFLTSAFEYQLIEFLKQPVLLDESFAQRFFTLRGYCGIGHIADAKKYAEAMPLPHGVVMVSTSPEICVERVMARKELPVLLQGEPLNMLKVRFREGNALLEALLEELESKNVPVLKVDGNGNIAGTSKEIKDFFLNLKCV